MAQHDYNIANDTAANVRTDLNNALSAVVSQNSGASAPSPTYANMIWYDTTNDILKMRNEANSGWINLMSLSQAGSTASPLNLSGILASQAEAEAGTENTKAMTALRVKQSIVTNTPGWELVTSSSTISSGIITITGLSSYAELMVFMDGVTSGNAYRFMQVGYSSGSSWLTTNSYTDTNGVARYGILLADGTDGSAAKNGRASITGFNKTWAAKPVSNTSTTILCPAIQSSTAFDSIRVYTAAGDGTLSTSSINGGTIYVFGR